MMSAETGSYQTDEVNGQSQLETNIPERLYIASSDASRL
jgi:hypothetical protein